MRPILTFITGANIYVMSSFFKINNIFLVIIIPIFDQLQHKLYSFIQRIFDMKHWSVVHLYYALHTVTIYR